MPESEKDIRSAVNRMVDNLGTIGLFMLGEVRAFLKKGWGSSQEEFMDAVDQVTKSMKQSGKMAVEDIERASAQIKSNWNTLDKEGDREWATFSDELMNRLKQMSDITQETYEIAVDQAKKSLDRRWTASGRLGEEQLESFLKHSEQVAQGFREQWNVFFDQMGSTGKKVDKAVKAAWDEMKKD